MSLEELINLNEYGFEDLNEDKSFIDIMIIYD